MILKEILEKTYNLHLSQDTLQTIDKYLRLLLEAPLNLTSIDDYNEAVHKHVADVLLPIKSLTGNLLDVGTGAGIPGLILVIVFPIKATLLDSSKKKIFWLNDTIKKLNLSNINTVATRAEDYAKQAREKFDVVTARAVAEVRILLELCAAFAKVGGLLYFYKGPNWKEEYKACVNIERILNVRLKEVIDYQLATGEKRSLIIFEKVGPTDPKFPRRYNQILKKPL
ncbi:methyltransferase GidB [Pseudothermotoga thermarum DSM 5069]|uniref:Ribosomal RNA small subunit methyltransferase G n=1 Tax=Pseudothermotoga thermarum DSM 5069 TaxID=688269 RepID=F7YVT3_9THEM|nr:16S rRNA (guanine(527)-N(7))-methyltransferase RsmG [Pseudothermotoga thermarum]AEH51754.1 methyltransferase GidB [Pseudothermotoga thermarum DSM 5069]